MKDRTLFWAALVMITAVGCGAFGAHGLKARITQDALGQWHTAVLYQLVHGLALFVLAMGQGRIAAKPAAWAARFFLLGVLFFSGSLYLLSTRELLGTAWLTPLLGPITPLGGLCFIGGWVVLLIGAPGAPPSK